MPLRKTNAAPPAEPDDLMTAPTFREVIENCKVEHHARQLAIKGEPSLNHPGLTVVEHNVLDVAERRNLARAADLDARAQALAQQLQQLSASPSRDPAILHHRTVDQLTGSVTARAPAIREAVANERTRAAEREAWRHEHDVARPADYPKSKLVHFKWLGVAVAGEAIAEATLLMPATPDGMLGATGLALSVTALTTALGLAIGFGAVRYLASSSATKRTAAWGALPVLTTLVLLVSFYVAHYRHVAGTANDTPADAQVVEHLLTQPFDLTGPGWLLLFMSLACAAFAAWKGYTASDPIPGYEKVDRAYVAARDNRDYLRTDLQAAVATVKTQTIKPLLDQPRLTRLKVDHLRSLAAELRSRGEQVSALARQEAALAHRAIAHFRRVNLATRADGVTPAYFSEAPVIPESTAAVPADLKDRVDAATAAAIATATQAAEAALQIARMLDHTSDRADEIMASIEQARPRDGDSPILELRAALEATLGAAALPGPKAMDAIPAPDATKS